MDPVRPVVWITNLEAHYLLRDATKKESYSIVTWFYTSLPENNFFFHEGEASANVVCVTFIVPKGTSQEDDSFSKFAGFPKRAGPILLPGIPGSVNWSPGRCHISLYAADNLLSPILKKYKHATLLNCWGGGNITNIGLVRFLS